MQNTEKTRVEKDSLGEMPVPVAAYWGIHTQRAIKNFPISGTRVPPVFIRAMAVVKKAACRANQELGFLPTEKATAIAQACDEILAGALAAEFPLDVLQGGAGTSTHMNVNEVIANRAEEILGGQKGVYAQVHPLAHVNLHQSTNDVYPTALKVAVLWQLKQLSPEIAKLQGALQAKEKEFASVVTLGRTEMQDAVPMTLGAQFSAFAEAIGRDRWRVFKCEERVRVVNLGGTAVGTGLCAPRDYIFRVTEILRELTALSLTAAENRVDQTANQDALVEVSGILKAHAANLIKVAGDLRLLASGREIVLPAMQAGSSIMPGKVNPVVLEATIQTALKVFADDFLLTEAVSRATLQINEWMPLVAASVLDMLALLMAINRLLAEQIGQIQALPDECARKVAQSPSIVTAFLPVMGYEKAAALLSEFAQSGGTDVRAFLVSHLGKEVVEKTLSSQNLLQLGYRHG